MKITLKMLEEKDACEPGVDWFIEHFGRDGSPDHTEILQKLYEQKHTDVYGGWMLRRFGLSGISTYWNDNGVKMCETPYVNGKEHGIMTWWWYRNGQKLGEIPYVNGKRHGIVTWWHENGDVDVCFYYINGIEVTKEEWEEYENKND
jgi:antitoxin component YwqK of YwqJK toxin-antitoxin module